MSLVTVFHSKPNNYSPYSEEVKTYQPEDYGSKRHLKTERQAIADFATLTLQKEKSPQILKVKSQHKDSHVQGAFRQLPPKVKGTSDKENQSLFPDQLKRIVDETINFSSEGTYADLQAIRRATKTLRCASHARGEDFKKAIEPLFQTLQAKKLELLGNPKIAVAIAEERFLALKEARKVRDTVVTTSQMFSLLEGRLLGVPQKKLKDVCSMLCREINEVMENPAPYLGKSIQLKAKEKCYPFYSYESGKTRELTLNFTYWLDISVDGKQFELFIVPLTQPLGSGSFKTVYKAQSFKILFKLEQCNESGIGIYKRRGSYTPMVMLEAKDSDAIAKIEKGIELQKKILLFIPASDLPSIPKKLGLKRTTPKITSALSQYAQEWCNCDLRKALKDRKIPLDIRKKTEMLDLKDIDILNIFTDVATTLIKWHEAGFIHRDIKTDNILLKVSSDGKTIKGLPADYDVAQVKGKGSIPTSGKYQFWDTLSNEGVVTPFTDSYGLSLSLAEAFIPEFDAETSDSLLLKKHQQSFLEKAKAISKTRARIVEKIILFTEAILKHDKTLSEFYPKKNRDDYIREEIQKIFTPFSDPLLTKIVSTIKKFETLSSLEKAHKLQARISKKLCRPIDNMTKVRLEEILKRIRQRKSKLIMWDRFEKMTLKERNQHPLFSALEAPSEIKIEKIEDNINKEIELIYPDDSSLNERIMQALDGLKTSYEVRHALKSLLQKIYDNPSENLNTKLESAKLFDEILIIEEAMAYAVEIGKIQKKATDHVVKQVEKSTGGIMQNFLTLINRLKEDLSSAEEKKEN